jgi:protein SCO1
MRPWNAAPIALLALRVASAAAAGPPEVTPSDSLYQLEAPLTAQDGKAVGLDLYRGQPALITMFYASCQATCPLIIETLRVTEAKLSAEQKKNLRVLLISIDPERDTAEALGMTARERRVDTSRWTLARTDEAHVRQIAAALGVQYRKLPNGEYSHATSISVLDRQGRIVAQSNELGRVDDKLVDALRR